MLSAQEITMKITKQYLNIPISHKQDRSKMCFEADGVDNLKVVVRLAPNYAEYWVFKDMTEYMGKEVTIKYEGNPDGLENIYQSDEIRDQATMYKEYNRPQFHFSTRRGWINDPNGLVYYDGEYHLFYQHNPFERDWENMHWGHAVSTDLVHWTELNDALYPDGLGTMFSGSAVIDYDNSAGWNKDGKPAMVAAYTAESGERQTQCIAYSLDNGRTFTKYEENPVIDTKEKWNSRDTRDPKVFWYAPKKHWVMVLNERDGHSIYNSNDLKEWKYQSHVTGFWECPELFELPIDGNQKKTKWVMYGATGTYMIGSFDGKVFTPEHGKYFYTKGSIYAAQTITNTQDGRRIQIGWGQIHHPDMPFNGMMMLPTELTLKSTREGVRLFNNPVEETETLFTSEMKEGSMSSNEANDKMKKFYNTDCFRVKTTIKLSHATSAGFNLFGQKIIDYDMNRNCINGVFYSPQDMTSMELTADIYVDRTSIEVFIDGGIYSFVMDRKPDHNNREGLHFWGNNIEVKDLEIFTAKSIWNK
ncbi:MAG: 2,6-beta-D-fructofuranosidase [Bacteroides xylanisolvens]